MTVNVLIAPSGFKESLSPEEVADCIEKGYPACVAGRECAKGTSSRWRRRLYKHARGDHWGYVAAKYGSPDQSGSPLRHLTGFWVVRGQEQLL